MWRTIIKPFAEVDLDDAFVWYEYQKDGLGLEFMLCFDATIERIKRNPFHVATVDTEIRSAMINRAPYEIIYCIEQKNIFILAVFHQSRNPKTWQDRMQ